MASLIDRAKPVFTAPSPDAKQYKLAVLRFFGGRGRSLVLKLIACNMFPTGDWRDPDFFEICLPFVPESEALGKAIISQCAHGFVYTVYSRGFSKHTAHRWRGVDLTYNDVGLGESINQSYSIAYKAWCKTFSGMSIEDAVKHIVDNERAKRRARASGDMLALRDDAAGGVGDIDNLEAPGATLPTTSRKSVDWAQENRNHRSKGLSFVSRNPHTEVSIMRLACEPFRYAMDMTIYYASEMWELEEQAFQVQKDLEGTAHSRDYRLTMAAECIIEKEAYNKLQMLFECAELWSQ